MRHTTRTLLTIVLLTFPALAADQVVLTNGDTITGTIVKKDGDKLTVKSEFLGEVTMPWKAVKSIRSDADLTVVDLKLQKTITDDWIASKCGWTPFAGRNVQGWPVGTILRGNIAMWDGELGQPSGAPVRFGAALPECY